MALIAISAPYGAGGSQIAPALAERLGVPFLDRPADTEPDHGLLSKLSSIGLAWGTPAGMELEDLVPGETRRREIEAELEALEHGVVLGRAAAFLKRDDPTVLRVLLHGPPERRVEQAMRMEGIDRRTAVHAPGAHRPGAAALPPDALLRRPAQAGPVPPRDRLDRALVRDVRGNDRAGKPAQMREAVTAAVDELSGELVELLQALIRLPTVNPPGEGYEAFVGDFARRLDALGYETRGPPRARRRARDAGPARQRPAAPEPDRHADTGRRPDRPPQRPLRRRARRQRLDARPVRRRAGRRLDLRSRRRRHEERPGGAGDRGRGAAARRLQRHDRAERGARRGDRRRAQRRHGLAGRAGPDRGRRADHHRAVRPRRRGDRPQGRDLGRGHHPRQAGPRLQPAAGRQRGRGDGALPGPAGRGAAPAARAARHRLRRHARRAALDALLRHDPRRRRDQHRPRPLHGHLQPAADPGRGPRHARARSCSRRSTACATTTARSTPPNRCWWASRSLWCRPPAVPSATSAWSRGS